MSHLRRVKNCIGELVSIALILTIWIGLIAAPTYSSGTSHASVKTGAFNHSHPVKDELELKPRMATASSSRTEKPDQAAQARVREAYGKLQLSFEANQGQSDARVKFLSRNSGYNLFLTATEAVMVLSRQPGTEKKNPMEGQAKERATPLRNEPGAETVLSMKLEGANPQPRVSGFDEMPGKSNYFNGNHPENWRAGISSYAKVRYENVYPGVDVVYYGNQQQLEFDFVVAPGANPKGIRFSFDGASHLRIDRNGDLLISTPEGEVRQRKPVTYQEVGGRRREVSSRYVLAGERQVKLALGKYDSRQTLIIDPVLSYASFLGGGDYDYGYDIAIDRAGDAYVVGQTSSTNFPTRGAAQSQTGAGGDAFITKINPVGNTIIYSTYLGGSNAEMATGVAVDASGRAFVTGSTWSTDFPTKNPYQNTYSGGTDYYGGDAFVVRLNPTGSALQYATYLGGSGPEVAEEIAVDAAGSVYLTGNTASTNFPTINAYRTANSGSTDAFLTKFNPAGTALVYSTYLGGSGDDYAKGLALDGSNNVYLTGYTWSSNFPTQSAFQTVLKGDRDAFITKFNSTGASLLYSTYLGGSTVGSGGDVGKDIVVDASGNAYVTGTADSADFPIQNAFMPTHAGGYRDAFVTKLGPAGNTLIFSTFLGGYDDDGGEAIALDNSGAIYVTGYTASANFPTLNAVKSTLGNDSDAFITKLNPAGNSLAYSTFMGGSRIWVGETGGDTGNGIAVDPFGNAFIVGTTSCSNFQVKNPFDGSFNYGQEDGFVARIDDSATAHTISGSVTDRYGNAISDATVTLSGPQNGTAQTDAAGNYIFGNQADGGDYNVTVTKTDYTFSPPISTFTGLNADKAANFTGTSPYDISGQITDSSGAPLQAVKVILSGTQEGVVYTDPDGHYSLNVAPHSNSTVTPQFFGYAFAPVNQVFNDVQSSQTADFVGTYTSYTISGQVVVGGGAGLSGVTVTLSNSVQPQTTQTDANGNYSFANLAGGGDYTVEPSLAGYDFNPPNQTFLNLSADQTVNFAATTFLISGRVVDTGGVAMSDVTMTLYDPSVRTTQTDANGNYSFNVAPSGSNFYLSPSKDRYVFTPDYQTFPSVTANQTANFTGKRLFTISGRITDFNTNAIEGVTVRLGGSSTGSVWTDPTGYYSIDAAEGGNYTVTPSMYGYGFTPVSQSFNALNGDRTANFIGSITISGRVTNTSGVGVSGVTMTLSGAQTGSVLTNSTGNYSFSVAPGWTYTVTPSKVNNTFQPTNQTFTNMTSPQTANFTTVVYDIAGRVTDAVGTGLSGVTMTLSGAQTGTAVTNATGNFSFKSLPAGYTYNVTPSKTNYIFNPGGLLFGSLSSNQTANFIGALAYTISGKVTNTSGAGVSGVTVILSGSQTRSVATDASGNYSFPALPAGGNFRVTASKPGWSLSPTDRSYNSLAANQTTANFSVLEIPYWIAPSLVGQDIGTVGLAGSTSLSGETYTVKGAGSDIGGTADSFHYARQQMTGDGRIVVRVTGVQNTNAAAKAGVMMRETLTAGSNYASLVLSPSGGISFIRRTTTGAAATNTADATVTMPYWLMLMRKGNEFVAYRSLDGTNWVYVNAVTITMPATIYVGLAVTSKTTTALNTSTFDGLSLTGGTTNNPPQVSITSPGQGTTHNSNPGVTINATATDRDGAATISQVEFYADSTLIGIDTTSPYSMTWAGAAAGTYTLTARVVDTSGEWMTSSGVSITVNPSTTSTFIATADTHVRNGTNAAVNYGTATTLEAGTSATAGNTRDAYLKFDTNGISSAASAKLRIFASMSAAGTYALSAYSVSNTTWVESGTGGMTWNTKPALGATALSSNTVANTTFVWYEFDVTSFVQAEKAAGRHVVTLALHGAANSTLYVKANPREAATSKPELRISSTNSGAPAITTLSPASGPVATSVTITGSNFGAAQDTSTVTFNGIGVVPATWSATSIVAKVPAGATTGPVVVTVGGRASNSVTFTVAGATGDTDGDGLPDSWETQYFGNLSQNGSGDPDGDGVNNLAEYQQGRHPNKGTVADTGGSISLRVWTLLRSLF